MDFPNSWFRNNRLKSVKASEGYSLILLRSLESTASLVARCAALYDSADIQSYITRGQAIEIVSSLKSLQSLRSGFPDCSIEVDYNPFSGLDEHDLSSVIQRTAIFLRQNDSLVVKAIYRAAASIAHVRLSFEEMLFRIGLWVIAATCSLRGYAN